MSPTSAWSLRPKEALQALSRYKFTSNQGGTTVDVETEYTIPVPVLGKLAEKLVLKRNQRESEMGLANLKERLEV